MCAKMWLVTRCLFGVCRDIVVVFFSVFFFKQKTAYEIVDCDWSSDVCSSDLLKQPAPSMDHLGGARITPRLRKLSRDAKITPLIEIGRASCRERV